MGIDPRHWALNYGSPRDTFVETLSRMIASTCRWDILARQFVAAETLDVSLLAYMS